MWGGVTQITIWVSIITHIASWGNTDYLLKQFSAQPAQLKLNWQKNIADRLPVLLIACVVAVVYLRNSLGLLIALWCIFEYAYQSYEPLINFRKKFKVTVVAEISGTVVLFSLIYLFRDNLDLTSLITLCIVSDMVKTGVVVLYFIKTLFPLQITSPDFKYYQASLWFFLLGFVGLLSSRTDLIYVTSFLSKPEIAFYQVATAFFTNISSIAHMLILPFVPALYRLNKSTTYKLSFQFTGVGIVLSLAALVVVYFIITMAYQFQMSLLFMAWGFAYVLPAFFSYSLVIHLFKTHKQHKVVLLGIFIVAVNFTLCTLLVPHYGTLGAIASAAIAQWALVPLLLYQVQGLEYRNDVSP